MSTTHTQIAQWADEYVGLKNQEKALAGRMKFLKEQIQMNVPAGTDLSADGRYIKHTVYEKTTLNTTRVKTDFPDVYAECAETKEETRLTVS